MAFTLKLIFFTVLIAGTLVIWGFGSFIAWYLTAWTGLGFIMVVFKPLLLLFFWGVMGLLFRRTFKLSTLAYGESKC